MSSGHFDDEPKKADFDALRRVWRLDAVRDASKRFQREDRQYRVPYLAGASNDGQTLYIDAKLPSKIAEVPLALSCGVHEGVELALVQKLGWKYEPAHRVALAAERLAVEEAGYEWEPYRVDFEPYFGPIEHEALCDGDVPPDLALYPYTADMPLLRKLIDLTGRKLEKDEAGYRLGRKGRNCGLCSMFRGKTQSCDIVAGRITSRMLCDYFERRG